MSKSKRFWGFLVLMALSLGSLTYASQHNELWLQIARAYFTEQCELNDWEPQDNGKTAYYFTCLI